MKKSKIIILLLLITIFISGCAKELENSEASQSIDSTSIVEETSPKEEVEPPKSSQESEIEVVTEIDGNYKDLKYKMKSDWKIDEKGDLQLIVIKDQEAAIILDSTSDSEKEQVKDYTMEDIKTTTLSMVDEITQSGNTRILTEAIVDDVSVAGLEGIRLEIDVAIDEKQGKFVFYTLKDLDRVYYVNYNTLLEVQDLHNQIFIDFINSIEK